MIIRRECDSCLNHISRDLMKKKERLECCGMGLGGRRFSFFIIDWMTWCPCICSFAILSDDAVICRPNAMFMVEICLEYTSYICLIMGVVVHLDLR